MGLVRRDYQIDTSTALRKDYDSGLNRLGVNWATGLGKTSALAAFLPEEFPELAKHGVIFLSHRREILMHAYNTFKRKWGKEKWIGLEMGEYHCTGEEDFMFMSVDSIGRVMGNRISKFKHRWPGLVIVDEGHHVCEDGTWSNILNYFGVGDDPKQFHTFADGTKPLSVFLSATFVRADGQALKPWLDKISASYDVLWAIREGWLCDIKCYHAELTSHEYKEFDAERQVDYLIKTWEKWGTGMRTLAFAKNVPQSIMLANTLTQRGKFTAAHVDAKTPDEDRQESVRRFALDFDDPNAIDFMSNRLIFTEGYDNPVIECILDNAPTKSQGLYVQKIGRGLRVDPSVDLGSYGTAAERKEAIRLSRKPYLTYITSFPIKHGLDMPATLLGLPKNIDLGEKMLSEVVDVILYEELIMPEAPIRDLAGMSSLEIKLKRQDIWTQTIYNEEIKALSQLRWIVGEEFAALRLPSNPFAGAGIKRTLPVVITWTKQPDGQYRLTQVFPGGWVESLKRPVRADFQTFDYFVDDLQTGITEIDNRIRVAYPKLYAACQRAHSGPATPTIKKYLKTKKVSANFDNLTMETAMLLKDHALIIPSLEKFDFPSE